MSSKSSKVLKSLERKLGTSVITKSLANNSEMQELLKELPLPPATSMTIDDSYRKLVRDDVISHFVLRLAFRNPSDHGWFIQQERNLFRLRLEQPSALTTFENQNPDLQWTRADISDLEAHPSLLSSLQRLSISALISQFYRVHFTEVLDLVSERTVVLCGGTAYVHEDKLLSLLLNNFTENLSKNLEIAHRAFVSSSEDRIGPFVDRLPKQYLGEEFVPSQYGDQAVDLATLDQLSIDHFPLCMRKAHGHVRTHHHMRHLGRLQYGLFLKGIGLTLEQSLEFWHSEFVMKAGEDGWKKKNYAYNIQHNYGQQGRRQSYTPYNCQKILSMPTNPGDDHGCPYKSLSSTDLAAFLGDVKEKKNILRLAEDRRYQEACIAFYKATRGDSQGAQLLEPHTLHPNKYYIESRRDAAARANGIVTGQNTSTNNDQQNIMDTSTSYVDEDALNKSFAEYDDLDLESIMEPSSQASKKSETDQAMEID